MNTTIEAVNETVEAVTPPRLEKEITAPCSRAPITTLIAVPLAVAVAFGVHLWASKAQPMPENHYSVFLGIMLGLSLVAAAVQLSWMGLRRWMEHMSPIVAVAVLLLALWEAVTSGLRWLP